MALPQHVATYNGITLEAAKITNLTSRAVFSEDHLDYFFTHTTVTIEGWANQALTGVSNASYLATLRKTLQVPRQEFTYSIDGTIVISATGSPNNAGIPVDANNGPIPGDFVIAQIIGSSVQVAFSLEFWVTECESGGNTPPSVISNRWSQRQEIDEIGMSTFTTNGTLRIRSGLGTNADSFREFPFPVTNKPQGFERKQIYDLSADGLTLTWTMIDKELHRAPVNGIGRFEATYTESNDMAKTGALTEATFRGSAVGIKGTSIRDIYYFLANVARGRIDPVLDIVRSSAIEESFHENKVSLSMVVIVKGQDQNVIEQGMNFRLTTRIGGPLAVFNGTPTSIGTRGNLSSGLAVNDTPAAGNCDSRSGNNVSVLSTGNGRKPNQTSGSAPSNNSSTLSTKQGNYSEEQKKHPYIRYMIRAETELDQHKVVGTLAKIASSGEDQQKIFQVAGPTTKKVVKWYAERLQVPPELLTFQIDDNHELLFQTVVTYDAELCADGLTFIYKMGGSYTYALKKNASEESLKALPKNPMLNDGGTNTLSN